MFQMKDEMQTAVKHNIRAVKEAPASVTCSRPSSSAAARR